MKFSWLQRLQDKTAVRYLEGRADDEDFRFVQQNALFSEVSPRALMMILESMTPRQYDKDEMIFHEGNPGVCMFMVKRGKVEIFSASAPSSDEETSGTTYSIVGEGDLFGEISVISMAYRTSSARALKHDTQLFTWSAYDVDRLLEIRIRRLSIVSSVSVSVVLHVPRQAAGDAGDPARADSGDERPSFHYAVVAPGGLKRRDRRPSNRL